MMSTPYEAHKYQPPPPPPKHSSSSSSGKNAKQKQPSFPNGTHDQNPATSITIFSACRNCRNKKVKCLPGPPLPSPSITSSASPASLENPGENLGTLSTMSSTWRVETVAQETHADAEEEEDEPIDDDAMQPVSDSEDAEQYPSVKKSTEVVDASFQEFISVVFAIFALGERARAWKREMAKAEGDDDGHETVLPDEAEAGVIWYERAQILHCTTLKDVNIHLVQCLTLLAAFQASVNAMPMSWLLAGQAVRVAQDLVCTDQPQSFPYHSQKTAAFTMLVGYLRLGEDDVNFSRSAAGSG
uniref:Unplaced genomic scaffold supercont1.8, whole genome shotgun sequence n=1 Tax=Cryptococcus bacillisporus CA1280 TaxID=1296109 RepID=A0A0D0UH46_CRYGA|nr:hypothetical protein I312_03304 [Cryptococcus bacillisporus CA1280]